MHRNKPLFPDGSEVYIGAVVALITGGLVFLSGFPWWTYMLVALLLYVACVYGIQFWSADDRIYWKADELAKFITSVFEDIGPEVRQVRSQAVRQNIIDGIANTKAILAELRTKRPSQFYGGVIQLEPQVRRMLSVQEYVEVIQNPRIAGAKYNEIVTKAEEGFQGFAEESQRLLEQANAGDILNLAINAEMLRSLRNLLDQNKGEVKP